MSSRSLQIGERVTMCAVSVDVGNGVDKWILMLFPAQPVTHESPGRARERTREGQKDSTKVNNCISSPSVVSLIFFNENESKKDLLIKGYFVHPRYFSIATLPSLSCSIINLLARQQENHPNGKSKAFHFDLFLYKMSLVIPSLMLEACKMIGSIL